MKQSLIGILLVLLATPLFAQDPFNSEYDGSTRTFPDEACPSWLMFDTSASGPALLPDSLLLGTDQHSENISFVQVYDGIFRPDPILIEFRARYVSGSSGTSSRTNLGVGLVPGPDERIQFFVGSGFVFLTTGSSSAQGPSAAVDTSDFHTYRLEVHSGGLVEVFYDEAYLLQGSTNFILGETVPRVYWGEYASAARGRTEWAFLRHNVHPTGCADPDVDGDGSPVSLDCDDQDTLTFPGASEVFDNSDNDCDGLVDEELDDDHDGIPNAYDLCAGTAFGAGVDPDGCEVCSGEPAPCQSDEDDEDDDENGDEGDDEDDDRPSTHRPPTRGKSAAHRSH